ncbi:S9 family peptidase [Paractinoplanes hotanensis]|uniref:Prolyl oligopeptidase family serine peptidase n=1 Tax=Paractinoplanes hotanensis TaxID=2906497 RepID=A0ABT0Y8W8_9ACTN|nr:prolyl oligopeptidase family serine peptidase [Actinoplanes hotanensis]MCM4082235.1 prolyl oligopeptidase family serine peptidase [Actinoplanes hotanensis]
MDRAVAYVDRADQAIHIADDTGTSFPTTAVEPHVSYGNLTWTGTELVAVRELLAGDEIVALDATGTSPRPLLASPGFLGSPRVHDERLAWLQWGADRMPWDGSELWVANYRDRSIFAAQQVAGGPDESVVEPQWDANGNLTFLSDRSGWWNLYRWDGHTTHSVAPMPADCAAAPWELGYASYAHLSARRVALTVHAGPQQQIVVVDQSGELAALDLPVTSIKPYVAATDGGVAVIAASATALPHVIHVDLAGPTPRWQPIMSVDAVYVAEAVAARPLVIDGPAGPLHALLYPPVGATGEWRAPLIVRAHPGPTASMPARLDGQVQLFCSHGFAVVDVDYRGSTSYSRAFRQSLYGRWGTADVEDCTAVAQYLVAAGNAQPEQVFIMGASAGGYTALQAVCATDVFAAAIARSAIVDPWRWQRTAPRWQRAHASALAGPAGAVRADRIRRPVLFIHGADDDVAPLTDVRALANTMGDHGLDHELVVLGDSAHEVTAFDDNTFALMAELDFLRRHVRT